MDLIVWSEIFVSFIFSHDFLNSKTEFDLLTFSSRNFWYGSDLSVLRHASLSLSLSLWEEIDNALIFRLSQEYGEANCMHITGFVSSVFVSRWKLWKRVSLLYLREEFIHSHFYILFLYSGILFCLYRIKASYENLICQLEN